MSTVYVHTDRSTSHSMPCCCHRAVVVAIAEALTGYVTVKVGSQVDGSPSHHAVNWRKARHQKVLRIKSKKCTY